MGKTKTKSKWLNQKKKRVFQPPPKAEQFGPWMSMIVIYVPFRETSENDSQKRFGDFNSHLALSKSRDPSPPLS